MWIPAPYAYSFQTSKSGSTSMTFTRSSVTTSKSRTDLLYSGGFPAVTMTHPFGTFRLPKVFCCRNCSIVGASVSETQLISSMNRMPSFFPDASIRL